VSRERVERILEGIDAFNRGEFEAVIQDFPDDIEWQVLDQLPDQGPFRGREGVLRFWESWRESFSDFHAEIDEIVDTDDHVIVMLHMVGRGRDSGADVKTPTYAQMWTFRGEEVERVRMLQSKEEALEAAGISDP
jgi:ketosteroid isomerase-like protein